VLVLTRRSGESVMVGDDIVVTVLDVRADTVRLGIQAPRQIAVHREEVYEEIKAANRAAASPQEDTVAELRRRLRTRGGQAVNPPRTDERPKD
jgi:carbon storage regulator